MTLEVLQGQEVRLKQIPTQLPSQKEVTHYHLASQPDPLRANLNQEICVLMDFQEGDFETQKRITFRQTSLSPQAKH
eukprot:2409132-Ditylum_brightwellii.AAC.1